MGTLDDAGLSAAKVLYRWSEPQPAAARLTPMRGTVWPSRASQRTFGSQDVCFLGEDVAVAYLRQYADQPDARRIGGVMPIDVLSSAYAVEVKAGLVTNGPRSAQWRLTFSEARGDEHVRLDAMTKADQVAYFKQKRERILRRKLELLAALREKTGRSFAPLTIAMIVDPATRDVDLFWFEGFHQRLGWSGRAARAAYRGSFHVEWDGR